MPRHAMMCLTHKSHWSLMPFYRPPRSSLMAAFTVTCSGAKAARPTYLRRFPACLCACQLGRLLVTAAAGLLGNASDLVTAALIHSELPLDYHNIVELWCI